MVYGSNPVDEFAAHPTVCLVGDSGYMGSDYRVGQGGKPEVIIVIISTKATEMAAG